MNRKKGKKWSSNEIVQMTDEALNKMNTKRLLGLLKSTREVQTNILNYGFYGEGEFNLFGQSREEYFQFLKEYIGRIKDVLETREHIE